jgi:hypothetical protein
MAKIASMIATDLNLPSPATYTGHSLRVTSATILADAGISMINLKRQGGWKSDAVAEGYLRGSKKLKQDTAALITSNQTISITPTASTVSQSVAQSTVTQSAQPSINFKGTFHNCTFHIIQK